MAGFDNGKRAAANRILCVVDKLLTYSQTPSTPSEIHPSLHAIHNLLTQPQFPIPGVPPHTCQLSGLILLPSPNYPAGPVATVPPSSWADTINTRLLSPILITQLFLPLLTLRNNSSAIIFLYPSISSSLSAPFSAAEVAVTRALSGFATSLRRELHIMQQSSDSSNNIDVVELKLGNIDFGSQYRPTHSHIAGTEVLTWTPQHRALYGPSYISSVEQRPIASTGSSLAHGSPARVLHYAIFDSLTPPQKSLFGKRKQKRSVVYIGRGSRLYGIIGEWVPSSLVGWMLSPLSGSRTASGRDWAGSGTSSENGWEKVG